MRVISVLVLILVLFSSCNTRPDSRDIHSTNEIVEVGIAQDEPTNNQPFTVEQLDTISTYLKIMEYDQWQKLYETVITNNAIIRYEKNWQNQEISKDVLYINAPNIFSDVEEALAQNFNRSFEFYEDAAGNAYFIHLKIQQRGKSPINISFKNCRTRELENLISIINAKLPTGEKIIVKGELVLDTFVHPDSANNWADLKDLAQYNDASSFNLRNIDRNKLFRIDSTVFGESIFKAYSLKSSYIASVRNNIGIYYPCVILAEQYESDDIVKLIAVFMVDSTFDEVGDFEFLSGYGYDSEGEWESYGTFEDSILKVVSKSSMECYKGIEGISKIKTEKFFSLTAEGVIELIRKDTLEIEYCK